VVKIMEFGFDLDARIHRKNYRGWGEEVFIYWRKQLKSEITQESHANPVVSISYLYPRNCFWMQPDNIVSQALRRKGVLMTLGRDKWC
jgi:hypothetical protein